MRTFTCSTVHFIAALMCLVLHGASADELLRLPPVDASNAGNDVELLEPFRAQPISSVAWDTPWNVVPASAELPVVVSDDLEDLRQRLQATEHRLAELERSNEGGIRSSDTSMPALFRDKWKDQHAGLTQGSSKGTRPTVTVFGRMHLEALAFPSQSPEIANFENPTTGTEAQDRLQFRRIRIGAQGDILETGVYRVEFDLGNPSRATFRDTYIGFEDLPVLQTLLIGNQKRPLGLDTWTSNQHVVFFERPLALNAFNPNYRRLGIETYGHSDSENLNWQFGVFELEDLKEIGRDLNDPIHFSINGRISGTPWYDELSDGRSYLHLGISNMYATTAPMPSPSGNNGDLARFSVRPEFQTTSSWVDTGTILGATCFDITGLETVLNLGSLQLQGEYLTTFVERPSGTDLNFDGGYVQAAYFITGEFEEWDRQSGRLARPKPLVPFVLVRGQPDATGWGAWQIAARWSYVSLSDKDIAGGRQENVTLGLNWYWTAYSKLMFNLVSGHIKDRAPVNGSTAGNFTGMGVRVLMDF